MARYSGESVWGKRREWEARVKDGTIRKGQKTAEECGLAGG